MSREPALAQASCLSPRKHWFTVPAALAARGLGLRPAGDSDLPALRAIFASTRADELALAGWPDVVVQKFVAEQFEFQHRHFTAAYPDAGFLLIESGADPIGRVYWRSATAGDPVPFDQLIDVALLPVWRGQGIGSALIEALIDDARERGCGVELQVMITNRGARRLYERLGFATIEAGSSHLRMRRGHA